MSGVFYGPVPSSKNVLLMRAPSMISSRSNDSGGTPREGRVKISRYSRVSGTPREFILHLRETS